MIDVRVSGKRVKTKSVKGYPVRITFMLIEPTDKVEPVTTKLIRSLVIPFDPKHGLDGLEEAETRVFKYSNRTLLYIRQTISMGIPNLLGTMRMIHATLAERQDLLDEQNAKIFVYKGEGENNAVNTEY